MDQPTYAIEDMAVVANRPAMKQLVLNGQGLVSVSMKAIQEWLGHSNFSTTANIYAHLGVSAKQVAADALNTALQKVMPEEAKELSNRQKNKKGKGLLESSS